jgi:glyoxylase-like metal-dependent hydrolase (beta-lactamase superfamily II)
MVYPYDGTPGVIPFTSVGEGDEIQVGEGRLGVLHTPGHTEGSVTLLAGDRAAMTGDFLFVESVGRPDLAGRTEEWSEHLWASTQRALTQWPGSWTVLPAHYSVERERNPDRTIAAEMGELRETNEALKLAADRERFVSWVIEHEAPAPDTYPKIKAINVGLITPNPSEADLLEVGRNECAIV